MTHDNKQHDHKKVYKRVWLVLLTLTAITIGVAHHDYGNWNIFIAMLIATIKASLVILFFMHLIYDNRLNQVVFSAAFVFLALFAGLTASDAFFRPSEQPAKTEKVEDAAVGTAEDIAKLKQPTNELIEQGENLYGGQCATCHGANGGGDGPAAGALNPKPRNFTSADGWKFDRTPNLIFKTLTEGLPGTSMPPFAGLSAKDRWALVHFVRTLTPNPPDDPAGSAPAQQGTQAEAKSEPRLPISVAMRLMTVAEPLPSSQREKSVEGNGAELYSQHCSGCHGAGGEGAVAVQAIGVNPYVRLKTRPFAGSLATWKQNEREFIKIISEGLPGFGKPGFGHFTTAQWHVLYEYTKTLGK